MKPRIEIDDARRRVVLTSGCNVMARELNRALISLVLEKPERADHDFILDLRESYGDGSHDDVVRTAEMFRACGAGRRASHTCFISFDGGFVHWARTMDFCFTNRTHQLFSTPEEAHAFLDRRQDGGRAAEAA
ncbi:hypothetical protein [Brevundimonas sp.]|uniref:hypothetical protein n=1 Tax=Brevundimonas sp. TaxID=1871086 RepID=UPI001DA65E20|nr:hypothetical protein [Brevundimonas sp.]MBA3999747.1 hypothetical protein [Brevundimonas sp.]